MTALALLLCPIFTVLQARAENKRYEDAKCKGKGPGCYKTSCRCYCYLVTIPTPRSDSTKVLFAADPEGNHYSGSNTSSLLLQDGGSFHPSSSGAKMNLLKGAKVNSTF